MRNSKYFYRIIFTIIIFISYNCETIDLDQTEDPSGIPAYLLDPILAFNYVQIRLPDFVDSSNDFTQRVTRQIAMTGGNTYDNAFAPINFNNNWSTGYNILNAIKFMEPKCIEKKEYYALGASKVIRAYVLMSLVDMYGDIPYTEALLGFKNLKPKYDSSAFVYKQILLELDQAILDLNTPNNPSSTVVQNDLYYKNQNGWIVLANTLKFKLYNNSRLAGAELGVDIGAKMTEILALDIIDTQEEDFQFKYGTSRFTPNTRHPLYNDQYESGGGAYIGNYIMWAMTTEKGYSASSNIPSNDPRTSFYFYKQDGNVNDENEIVFPGKNRSRPEHYNDGKYDSFYNNVLSPYVISNWVPTKLSDGYWGRDHGDNSGIPQDADKRTVAGVYPIGGKYGTPGAVQSSGTQGALGAGIMPIVLSSYVSFMIAEASLEVNGFQDFGRARLQFEKGINLSVNKVVNLIPNYPVLTLLEKAALDNNIVLYTPFMLGKYDSATNAGKLEIIIKEYYLASWGNGIEPYNAYRRTGYPSNFQPTIEPISGEYYYTALYSASAVNGNQNVPLNVRTRKVFWDKANLNLH